MTAKTPKSRPSVTPTSGAKLFSKLAAALYANADTHIERVKLFGLDCLRFEGKVFATLHNGNLVMKLSPKRVASLIDSGIVGTYESRGRLMKEWVGGDCGGYQKYCCACRGVTWFCR